MQASDSAVQLIHKFEKCELIPYRDSRGIWTVGWGHAMLDPHGQSITAIEVAMQYMKAKFGAWTLTQQQADEQSVIDVGIAADEVTNAILSAAMGQAQRVVATQPQFDAMTSLTFNIGGGNFRTSSVRRLHNAGDCNVGNVSLSEMYAFASKQPEPTPQNMQEAFVSWSHGNGVVELGLFRRRIAELLLYSGWAWDRAYQTAESFTPRST